MKHLLFSLVLAGSLFSFGTAAVAQAATTEDTGAEVTALLEREAADLNIREVALLQAEVRSLRTALARIRGEEAEPIVEVAAVEEHGPCPLESLAQLAGKPFQCEGHSAGEAVTMVAEELPIEEAVAEEEGHEHGAGSCALSKLAALAGEPECDARFEAAPVFASLESVEPIAQVELAEAEAAPEPIAVVEPVLVLEPVEVDPVFEMQLEPIDVREAREAEAAVEPSEVVEPIEILDVVEPVVVVERGASLIQAALEPFWASDDEEACGAEVVIEEPVVCEADEEPIACALTEVAEEVCTSEVQETCTSSEPEVAPLPESLIGAQIELAVVRAKIAKAKSELAAIEAELEAARGPSSCDSISVVPAAALEVPCSAQPIEAEEACVEEASSCEATQVVAEPSSCESSSNNTATAVNWVDLSGQDAGIQLASVTSEVEEATCSLTAPVQSACTGLKPVATAIEFVTAPAPGGCEKETTSASEGCHKLQRAHEELLAGRAELAELQARLEARQGELASLRAARHDSQPLDSRVSLRVR